MGDGDQQIKLERKKMMKDLMGENQSNTFKIEFWSSHKNGETNLFGRGRGTGLLEGNHSWKVAENYVVCMVLHLIQN